MNPTDRPLSRPLRRLVALLIGAAVAVALTACGEKKETVGGKTKQDRVVLLLDWIPNADHAGIYTGLANDRFKQLGIQLEAQSPSDPAAVIKQVAAGRVDLGISYQPEVMSARDEGVKIKAIAAIVPTPLNSVAWLKKSGIRSVKDLKGKTIATTGAYQDAYLDSSLTESGVKPSSVNKINVGYDVLKALLSGKADAIVGVYPNVEGVTLKQRNRPATVLTVDKIGVPKYNELVVIASEDALKDARRAEIYRRFLGGLSRGTLDAVKEPNAALAALRAADKALEKDPSLDASLKATLPLLGQSEDHPFGYMDPTVWLTFANWMRDNKLLKNAPDAPSAYTNDLLPGQGPGGAESHESEPTSTNGGY